MTIIDTHAHLDQLDHLDQSLKDADRAGVNAIVAVSMDLTSCRKNLDIKNITATPQIYLAMGMHPSQVNLDELEQCIQFIRENALSINAIGEIGLDFWYQWVRKDQKKKDEQREVFHQLLQLTKELDMPAIIHSRGTWRECFETVKQFSIKRAVFHWYSGPSDVLDDILSRGYYISTTPSLAYSPQLQEAIHRTPIERILIETDSPVYYRSGGSEDLQIAKSSEGFHAQPKDVFKTLKAYCQLCRFDKDKALEIFNRNARDFFEME